MPKAKNKAVKRSQPSLITTTLGDLICQVYNAALDDSHDPDIARRLACHCARRAVRHQPHIKIV